MAILRCLYGSEIVLLGVVVGKCEMPSSHILQDNEHALLLVKPQFGTNKYGIDNDHVCSVEYRLPRIS